MTADMNQLGILLGKINGSVVTAESCTGGFLADLIVQTPGASAWFAGGWVAYSNELKTRQLGIDEQLIEKNGAVSWQVAQAMCEGAVEQSGATAAISTTGIAGPSGGTEEKPVGTVFIGCLFNGISTIREFRFSGDRLEIRSLAAYAALEMLRLELLGESVDMMCCQYGATIG